MDIYVRQAFWWVFPAKKLKVGILAGVWGALNIPWPPRAKGLRTEMDI